MKTTPVMCKRKKMMLKETLVKVSLKADAANTNASFEFLNKLYDR